jgi:hypothetical protein
VHNYQVHRNTRIISIKNGIKKRKKVSCANSPLLMNNCLNLTNLCNRKNLYWQINTYWLPGRKHLLKTRLPLEDSDALNVISGTLKCLYPRVLLEINAVNKR